MKCLVVASIFPPINGGSAVVYESLCRYNADSTFVLAPRRNYMTGQPIQGWMEHDRHANYPIVRVELLRPRMIESQSVLQSAWLALTQDIPIKLKVLYTVWRLIRRYSIKAICIGELDSGSWLGLTARRLFGIPYINYIHGEEITTHAPYRFFGRRRRNYLDKADGIVAVSRFTRQALIEQMGVSPDKITLIENGVDAERFQPAPKDPTLIARYQLQGKQILLTVGRLVERKGIDMMLQALPRILQICPAAHYIVVGEGEYRQSLENLVVELGLQSSVTFTGRIDYAELAAHYQLCDLFVMPNRELANHDTEGFGLVYLEANACGKAAISGLAGGVVEAVRHGENGLNVDGTNPEAIAAAVIDLLTDDSKRQRLANKGLEVARASSSQVKAQQFQKLCEQVAARRERA